MKTFDVIQIYASIEDAHNLIRMKPSLLIGRYQARDLTSALNKAAKQQKLSASLLAARVVVNV